MNNCHSALGVNSPIIEHKLGWEESPPSGEWTSLANKTFHAFALLIAQKDDPEDIRGLNVKVIQDLLSRSTATRPERYIPPLTQLSGFRLISKGILLLGLRDGRPFTKYERNKLTSI